MEGADGRCCGCRGWGWRGRWRDVLQGEDLVQVDVLEVQDGVRGDARDFDPRLPTEDGKDAGDESVARAAKSLGAFGAILGGDVVPQRLFGQDGKAVVDVRGDESLAEAAFVGGALEALAQILANLMVVVDGLRVEQKNAPWVCLEPQFGRIRCAVGVAKEENVQEQIVRRRIFLGDRTGSPG